VALRTRTTVDEFVRIGITRKEVPENLRWLVVRGWPMPATEVSGEPLPEIVPQYTAVNQELYLYVAQRLATVRYQFHFEQLQKCRAWTPTWHSYAFRMCLEDGSRGGGSPFAGDGGVGFAGLACGFFGRGFFAVGFDAGQEVGGVSESAAEENGGNYGHSLFSSTSCMILIIDGSGSTRSALPSK